MRLDEVDYRLLTALQEDARTSIKELAKKVGVSVPTIRARMRQLRRLGVIRGYSILLDSQKVTGGIKAYIRLKVRPAELEDLGERLRMLDEVMEVHLTTGESNLLLKASFSDLASLQEFVARRLGGLPGVESVSSELITSTLKELLTPPLKPGLEIRMMCRTCGREIKGEAVKVKLSGHEYYFCCKSCSDIFRRDRSKVLGVEP